MTQCVAGSAGRWGTPPAQEGSSGGELLSRGGSGTHREGRGGGGGQVSLHLQGEQQVFKKAPRSGHDGAS